MTHYTHIELYGIALTVFYDKNDIITVESDQTERNIQQQITGLQAEVLHTQSIDRIERVGNPRDIFVTPRDVYELTDYADVGRVRERLDDLTEAGLLEFHGDIASRRNGESRLYLPAEVGRDEVSERLHNLDNRSIPSKLHGKELENVVPSDFSHKSGSIFVYDKDCDVQVDVGAPADGGSIRGSVERQLTEHGMTADINNFYYALRDRAGLTG